MTPLLYALHSGNLFGTERMAIATLRALRTSFDPVLLAPPGPVHAEAARHGLAAFTFSSPAEFAAEAGRVVRRARRLALMATGVIHSLAMVALQQLYRRDIAHLHVVHGGTDERLSYGRKRVLNRLPLHFVAVSDFVRDRLTAHGVRAEKIRVIENFLTGTEEASPRRSPFAEGVVRRVAVVSRIDPNKRVDLLLDALDRAPALAALEVSVYGTGWDLERLRRRAAARNPNVVFHGFSAHVAHALAHSDLLAHLCPEEPFGLAILEAMAAGVPVLCPASGGAGSLVDHGRTGFHFRPNDPTDLATALEGLRNADAAVLNRVVAAADVELATRFAKDARIADYRRLLTDGAR